MVRYAEGLIYRLPNMLSGLDDNKKGDFIIGIVGDTEYPKKLIKNENRNEHRHNKTGKTDTGEYKW